MFTEILKIIPKLSQKDLNEMDRNLSQRFGRVAKKFGKGVLTALAGGGLVGVATGIIAKILNPLEAVQEAIERSLNKGDDLVTYAKQFNTTEGNLARLQAFGQASGLEPEGVRVLLEKFQAAVARAAVNPDEPSAVSKFVGKKDTAEAFFEFIQALQEIKDTNVKSSIQQEVFGERQILKASEFLEQDFKALEQAFNSIGVASTDRVTGAAKNLGARKDALDVFTAVKDFNDIVKKEKLVSDSVVQGQINRNALDLKQENTALGKAQTLQEISLNNQKLLNTAVNLFLEVAPVLATLLPKAVKFVDTVTPYIPAIAASRLIRDKMSPGRDK